MYRVLILLTALLVNAGIHAVKIQIDKPEWPLNYKVVFILFSKLNLIMNHSLTNDEAVRSYKTISYTGMCTSQDRPRIHNCRMVCRHRRTAHAP